MCKSCKYLFRVWCLFVVAANQIEWISFNIEECMCDVFYIINSKCFVFCTFILLLDSISLRYFRELCTIFLCVSRCHFEIFPHSFQLIYLHTLETVKNESPSHFMSEMVCRTTTFISISKSGRCTLWLFAVMLLLPRVEMNSFKYM